MLTFGKITSMSLFNKKASTKKTKSIHISDYMAKKLITFSPEQSIMEVMEILIRKKISGGPVVDEKKQLIGMISEGDCMKQISDSRYYNQPIGSAKVKEYMITDVETIDANKTIFDAANHFYKSKRKRFPVMEHGKLVGQISRRDVVKAVVESNHQTF